jgi:hypothetical protein
VEGDEFNLSFSPKDIKSGLVGGVVAGEIRFNDLNRPFYGFIGFSGAGWAVEDGVAGVALKRGCIHRVNGGQGIQNIVKILL